MRVTYFRKNNIHVEDVSNRLAPGNSDRTRGDREISGPEPWHVVWVAAREDERAPPRRPAP